MGTLWLLSFTRNDHISHSDSMAGSSSPPVPCTQVARTNHGDAANTTSLTVAPGPQVTGPADRFLSSDMNADSVSALQCHSHSSRLSYPGANGEDSQLAHWESTVSTSHFLCPEACRLGTAMGGGPRWTLLLCVSWSREVWGRHDCRRGGLESPWSLRQSRPQSPLLKLVSQQEKKGKLPKPPSAPLGSPK